MRVCVSERMQDGNNSKRNNKNNNYVSRTFCSPFFVEVQSFIFIRLGLLVQQWNDRAGLKEDGGSWASNGRHA